MTDEKITNVFIRRLDETASIPYELLLDADPSRVLIDNYLKSSDIYVALLDDKVIGTYVLFPISSKKVEIKNIAVLHDHQGKGVGTLMLGDAVTNAKAKGFKSIAIGTGNTSVGQFYLYQKEGFEITAIKKNFFVDHYPQTLYENGIQVKHMIVLMKHI